MAKNIGQQIQQGSEKLGLDLTDDQISRLQTYVGLLDKWNKVYNLSAIRDPNEMVSRHILDSLTILPYLKGDSLLDVGTGAGLPGIPVAIMHPEIAVTLLDTNSKKTRFLQQVKAELGLDNVTVVHARVEEAELPKFAMVTARAFATIKDIIDLTGQHCDDAGCLLLMKGTYPDEELDAMSGGFKLQDVVTLTVPDCEGQRHLVRLVKE